MTGAPTHPKPPPAVHAAVVKSVAAVLRAHVDPDKMLQVDPGFAEQAAEMGIGPITLADAVAHAAIAAYTDAVVPEGLFIARRSDGVDCVWRYPDAYPNSPQCIVSRATVGDEVWALLAAFIPTRQEA